MAGYQEADFEIVDYGLAPLPGAGLRVRGPIPAALESGGYLCALGAAQTFGRFTELPFPKLLGDELGLETLNLGLPGAGPARFLTDQALLDNANRAALVIVQVMSARSVSSSYFESAGTSSLRVRADGPDAPPIQAARAWADLLHRHDRRYVEKLVAETRAAYVGAMQHLLAALQPPTILLWFAQRSPDYSEEYTTAARLLGEFPQLVTGAMVAEIRPLADGYVECVTSRGLPQPLTSRLTGRPVAPLDGRTGELNRYYPSSEMHEDATRALRPEAVRLLGRESAAASTPAGPEAR